jgi:hypothetical protein
MRSGLDRAGGSSAVAKPMRVRYVCWQQLAARMLNPVGEAPFEQLSSSNLKWLFTLGCSFQREEEIEREEEMEPCSCIATIYDKTVDPRLRRFLHSLCQHQSAFNL